MSTGPGGADPVNTILSALESRERHDLLGALRTIRFALEAIQAGERFDGADGPEQLQALQEAVARIEEILQAPRPPH